MKKFIIKVSVDEEAVKKASGCDDLIDAISMEAGWMNGSGIYVDEIVES